MDKPVFYACLDSCRYGALRPISKLTGGNSIIFILRLGTGESARRPKVAP